MSLAKRTPNHITEGRQAVATGLQAAAAPSAAAAAPTQAEFNALRQTVVDLRAALLKAGVIKP